jgi:hypothetical protein
MFEFESSVNRDQSVKPVLEERHKLIILKLMPTEIDRRRYLMAGECLCHARIDAGVWKDAHVIWSMVISRLSSRKAITCRRGM